MDNCCLIGIGTAQGKAYTAARSGLNTRDFLVYLNENKVDLSNLQEEQKKSNITLCYIFTADAFATGIFGLNQKITAPWLKKLF